MAGWLGANFSSQIDQLKKGVSQVSTIVKDTLVVDDTWDTPIDENGAEETARTDVSVRTLSKEERLEEQCTRLDNLYRVAVQEKEAQCQTFRELLLEKENEVQELSRMVEENAETEKTKKTLEDVLKSAGKAVNGDMEYEQLVQMVTELVKSKESDGDEKVDDNIAENVVKKLEDENEVLSKKCKLLNEKLIEVEASNSQLIEGANSANSVEVVNNLKREVELLKKSNSKETDENSVLVTKLKENIHELNEKVTELTLSLETSQQDSITKENEWVEKISIYENQVSERDKAIKDLNEKTGIALKEQDDSRLMADNLKVQVADLRKSLEEEFSKIKTLEELHADELLSQKQKLDAMVEAHKSEVAVLKVTEQELLAELSNIKTNSKNLQSEVGQVRSELSSVLQEKNDSETKLQSSAVLINELQIKLDESTANCKHLSLELDEVAKSKEDLQARIDSNNTESENLQIVRMQLETSEKATKDMKKQLIAAEKSKTDIVADLEAITLNNQVLQTKLDASLESSESTIKVLESKLDNAMEMNTELQEKFDRNSAKYEEEIKDIQSKLDIAEGSLQDIQQKYDGAEELRKDLKAELDLAVSREQENSRVLQSQINDGEVLKRELQSTLEDLQKEKANLEEELKEQKRLHTKLLQKNEAESKNQVSCQELQESNKDLQLKLDLALASSQEKIDAMQAKLNTSECQIEIFSQTEEKLSEAETRNALLLEEQQMFRDKCSEFQEALNCSKQDAEDLQNKILELEQEKSSYQIVKDELEAKFTSLAMKTEELEADKKNLDLSNTSLQDNYLQTQENLKVLNETYERSQRQIEEMKSKEKDYNEALDSLKSINEMISKAARDNEASKKQLEANFQKMETEKKIVENNVLNLENKNMELNSHLDLVSSQKKELEVHFVESQNTIDGLRDEIKQLSVAKETRVAEEKDVDESEQAAIDKNMVQVLNEKIRENTQMKTENNYLLQNLTVEREAKEKLESELAECKQSYSSMNTEALKKLSMLVRDKDLEIESLSERNKSLLEVIENEKSIEKQSNDKESKLIEEIKRLKDENIKDKESVENSNELIYLKDRIAELERKLNNVAREKVVDNVQVSVNEDSNKLANEESDASDRSLVLRLETKSLQLESVEKEAALLSQELTEVRSSLVKKEDQEAKLKEELRINQGRIGELQQEVERVNRSLVSMKGMLEEKTTSNVSQQEQGLKYIAECERLSSELSQMTAERDSCVTQGKARLQEAQDLRREVSSIIEKKKRVEGEVERLRGHLVQVEEGYTAELMEGEEREKEMRKKVAQLEDLLRVATHTSSEVSESASQASTQLTAALETAASQRDQLSDQLASCEATLRTRSMELRNLQLALEGFQRQKENEIGMAEKNCEAKVEKEQMLVRELQEKLRVNKQQLDRAQQGLEAAARLSEQLDKKGTVIANLKQEISVREEMVKNMQEKLLVLSNNQVGRVDRDLVKNLVVGYATADDSKKQEVLRIIATVLDFNSEERGRTGLDGGAGGWLGGLLGSRSRHPSISQAPVEQSIAKAFIQFLEDESTPRTVVTLPVLEMARNKADQLAGRAGKTPSPLLSASPTLALPSLGNHTSHSPSILKSVLDEPEMEGSS